MLREFLRKELSDLEPMDIDKQLIDGIRNETLEILSWCNSNPAVHECSDYVEIVRSVVSSLPNVRLYKSLRQVPSSKSEDAKLLSRLKDSLARLYYLIFTGLIDWEGKVPVTVRRPIQLRGKVRAEGSIIYLDVAEAVQLESLGYVKIVSVPIY